MHIRHPFKDQPSTPESWADRWERTDQGMVWCWLRGIEKAKESPELAAKAAAGELPILAWKGGVERAIKNKNKIGSMQYLAAWQGLRGEDLDINLSDEITITCNRTGVPVTFTSSLQKLRTAEELNDARD